MNFLNNFSFNKLLSNKRFTIPLSIVLAFIWWVVLTIEQRPTMERVFSDMTVTLERENISDLSIIGDISQQKFTITVRGPKSSVGALTANDIRLYASAAAVDEPGEYKLDVALMGGNSDYKIVSISPSTLKVNFDYIDTREFSISAVAQGATAAEGLIAEGGIVSGTESDTVTISGPRTVLNKIETVAAVARVDKTLSATETFDADILLYDEENNEIEKEHLTLSAGNVKVTVPISKKKEVPIKATFSNTPAGFDQSSVKCKISNPTVTIIGTPDKIDKTTEITLSPIDIRKVSSASKSFDVAPKLPEGVRMFENNIESFTVEAVLDDYTEKTVTVSTIKYTGLGSKLSTEGGTAIKNVKICGPSSVIKNIDASKIYAQTDLTDKKAGEYAVEVSINFNGYKNVWAIGTYKTTVIIK